MKQPLLFEINARCWLSELSQSIGRRVTLSKVPKSEFQRWRDLGVTHLWLMGVWTTGPRSRERALHNPALRARCDVALPGWNEQDMAGSPYSIAGYEVDNTLGGEGELTVFREELHAHRIRLVLDFIPNHLGLDHPWLEAHPEYFVQSTAEREFSVNQNTVAGERWIAHAKDPFFPPWDDTLQLDYRRVDTRTAVLSELQRVAERCDGVRCDMAMLMLNEVFASTWADWPMTNGGGEAHGEFWGTAIREVKARHPGFLFLAEVYWNRERELQALGFDFTYDKVWLDELVARKPAEAIRHLHEQPADQLQRSARFLENHDEARAASLFSLEEHRAAAVATLGLPGMRFLHDGQLEGAKVQVPVQLGTRRPHPADVRVAEMYERVLAALRSVGAGQTDGTLLSALPAWADNPTWENFLLVQWGSTDARFGLVVVNLAPHCGQCHAPVRIPDSTYASQWRFRDLLGNEEWLRDREALDTYGLYLDLPPYAAQVFECAAVA